MSPSVLVCPKCDGAAGVGACRTCGVALVPCCSLLKNRIRIVQGSAYTEHTYEAEGMPRDPGAKLLHLMAQKDPAPPVAFVQYGCLRCGSVFVEREGDAL